MGQNNFYFHRILINTTRERIYHWQEKQFYSKNNFSLGKKFNGDCVKINSENQYQLSKNRFRVIERFLSPGGVSPRFTAYIKQILSHRVTSYRFPRSYFEMFRYQPLAEFSISNLSVECTLGNWNWNTLRHFNEPHEIEDSRGDSKILNRYNPPCATSGNTVCGSIYI